MVKEGYKMTEVGVIPREWEVVTLNQCLNLLTDFEANGSFSSVAENVKIYNRKDYAWYVRATDLENDTDLSEVKYVDKHSYNFLGKTKLYGGEVLVAKRGEIGKLYFFKNLGVKASLAPNLYLLKLNEKVDPFFVFSFFRSPIGQQQLKRNNASTSLGALYKDDVKAIPIPLPPLHEQRAIATALSDTDALLAALDALIGKKEAFKRGMMEGLLSGEMRLEGFSGEWEYSQLDEVLTEMTDYVAAGSFAAIKENVSVYSNKEHALYVRLFDLRLGLGHSKQKYVDKSSYDYLKKSNLFGGEILIANIGANVGETFMMPIQGMKATVAPNMIVWRVDEKTVDSKYLYYYSKSNAGSKAISDAVSGSGQPKISKGDLKKVHVSYPSLPEQRAIAAVLSDLDAELSALRARRAKLGLVKGGMMEALLGGGVRLV